MFSFKKITITAALILSIFFIFNSAFAQDSKIGYIDSWKIFENYKGKEDQQAQFDREQEEWEQQATEMEQEIEKLQTQLENNIMWSEEKRQEQLLKIEQKRLELQEFVKEIWGPQGKAYRRNAELTNPIIEEIIQVVQEIGLEDNYTMIFDVAESGIVYAAEGLDLTQRVIDVLNEKYEQQKNN